MAEKTKKKHVARMDHFSRFEDKVKLIEAVKAQPFIWDLTHKGNFNAIFIGNAWDAIAAELHKDGDYLHEKYEQATRVKMNRRGRLQVKDSQFNVPTAHDLIYLDESPDWCRTSHMLHWPGTHGRVCRKNSTGLESCAILCCGRGYNTKNIIVNERCNCKFHWCCQVKCQVCTKVLEEHTCK